MSLKKFAICPVDIRHRLARLLSQVAAMSIMLVLFSLAGCSDPSDPPSLNDDAGGGNKPPASSFTFSCTDLSCSYDASASSDSDGAIVSYSWDFGDGMTGTGVMVNHDYAADGSYVVVLTVKDDVGSTSTNAQTVTVSTGNNSPTVSFTYNCTDLSCSYDASASADPDGAIVSYSWDFGDGMTGTGVMINHDYAVGGSYLVVLEVTDNVGSTSTNAQTVTVSVSSGLDGQLLYDDNCAVCHGADATGGILAPVNIVGSTAAEIVNAINTVPSMSSLAALTMEEIQAIADYLGSLVVGTATTSTATWSLITLTDSNGNTLTEESDPATGKFLIDGSALSGALLAQAYFPNEDALLYGYAADPGILNITPITDQVVRIAAGGKLSPECFEGGEAAHQCFADLSAEKIEKAQMRLADNLWQLFTLHNIGTGKSWMNRLFNLDRGGMAPVITILINGRIEGCDNPLNPNGFVYETDSNADCYPDNKQP